MRTTSRPTTLLLLVFLACLAANAYGEQPAQVTVCQLVLDHTAYDGKLLQVTGFVLRGMDEFTFFDPSCPRYTAVGKSTGVWKWAEPIRLEYGGTEATPEALCCGARGKPREKSGLTGVAFSVPLEKDDMLRRFDDLLWRGYDRMVRATVVGRLFTRGFMHGYGPRACCSLFVIQKVLSVEPQPNDDVDYRASLQEADAIRSGNFHHWRSLLEGDPFRLAIEEQKKAEQTDAPWVFTDPDQVARKEFLRFLWEEDEAITRDPSLKPKQDSMSPLLLEEELIKQEPGRRVYEWSYRWDLGPRTSKHYVMVVSRPYLLSFYARDPKKIAWVVVDMVELGDEECGPPGRC